MPSVPKILIFIEIVCKIVYVSIFKDVSFDISKGTTIVANLRKKNGTKGVPLARNFSIFFTAKRKVSVEMLILMSYSCHSENLYSFAQKYTNVKQTGAIVAKMTDLITQDVIKIHHATVNNVKYLLIMIKYL